MRIRMEVEAPLIIDDLLKEVEAHLVLLGISDQLAPNHLLPRHFRRVVCILFTPSTLRRGTGSNSNDSGGGGGWAKHSHMYSWRKLAST